ncbi:DUF748 domain-containing protein [Chromatocurvus halotolerans]|uniref:Uncharacterized protein DUF748 n=1 Tax=Chromatocurvus halotolerans TaxID=1132028 RepID=A0A4V2SC88_9GAMM|nr:DUF748 domain-containing protein [Chromatocurvus halotolerans]TCO78400.1 uncharacterized protein DUF748 [Chromatocurvus halotolerans]
MLKRIVRILATVYLSYLAFCLLILMPAMNALAPRLVEQSTGRTLTSELILFNPFTLTLELRGMALNARTEGEPALVGFDRARVNLSTASLWSAGIVMDEILLHGLAVHTRRLEDGDFNLSDLIPAEAADDATAAESETPDELPAFTVHRIDFQADHLEFADESRSPVYRTYIDDLAFTVRDLSTVREAGSPYRLSVVAEHGGRLDWRGQLSLAMRESEGEIQLQDIDLRPAYRYLAPQLAFRVDSALLDVSGGYTASWRDAPSFQVENGSVALRALHLLPDDRESLPETWVKLDALHIDGIAINSGQRRVDVEQVGIDALDVAGFSEGDTHSLLPMFASIDEAPQTPQNAADTPAANDVEAIDSEAPWQLSLQQLATANTQVRWRSDYTTPAQIHLSPVQIELRDLDWPAQGASRVELSLRANDLSEMTLAGSLDIGSGDGSLDYQLLGQPLAWFNPILADFLRATIDDGDLQVDGSLTLADFAPVDLAATTTVERFALTIFGRDTAALSWRSLTVPDARVNLRDSSAAVGKVLLDGYRGSLHIFPDGRLNALMALPDTDTSADDDAAPDADTREDGGSDDWALQAAGLRLTDARIDFEDESLPIPFRTLIEQLEGSVGPVDSARPEAPTELTLKGSVDGYAPVTVDGSVAPFAETTAMTVNLRFSGVDIANLTPYSGTYAGYAIDAGTLNLDLGYVLEGDRLRGDNHMVISQMVLGEPVDSDLALDLPLKLALALLTDTRGVIDLEVPITGNIDNPEFSLGMVIGRALRNVLTKTVTAPFRFLANLVGSDQDLQTLAFVAGTDSFNDETRAKLDSLADALEQRPALGVLVRGSTDPQADLPALREQALRQQLLADGLSEDDLVAQNAAWKAALAARYQAMDEIAAEGNSGEETPAAEDLPAETLRRAILAAVGIPTETVETLIRSRAATVKRYLVTECGIAADRLTISGRAEERMLAGAVLDVST